MTGTKDARGDIFSRGFVSPRPLRHGYLGGTGYGGDGEWLTTVNMMNVILTFWLVKSLAAKPFAPRRAGVYVFFGSSTHMGIVDSFHMVLYHVLTPTSAFFVLQVLINPLLPHEIKQVRWITYEENGGFYGCILYIHMYIYIYIYIENSFDIEYD